jgi:hypothetical protein
MSELQWICLANQNAAENLNLRTYANVDHHVMTACT